MVLHEKHSLFGGVKLTTNPGSHKHSCSGDIISFNVGGTFPILSGGFSKNVLIFGADMSLSAHVDNKKVILHLGKGQTEKARH